MILGSVIGIVLLAIARGPFWIAIVFLVIGVAALVVAIVRGRRHWIHLPDGRTLDEEDPHRTPEQQAARDERVRRQNAEMTPGQEAVAGLILIGAGVVQPVIVVLLRATPTGGDFLGFLAFVVIGICLLLHAAWHRIRNPHD